MSKYSESVKPSLEKIKRAAQNFRESGKQDSALEFESYAEQLEAAMSELIRLDKLTKALPSDLGNLHELPQELLDELSVTKTDELEDQLVAVINSYDGEASLDQILVGIFNKFGDIHKRRFLQNKLYRMVKAKIIWSLGGRKGIYLTKEPSLEGQLDGKLAELEIAIDRDHADDVENEAPF